MFPFPSCISCYYKRCLLPFPSSYIFKLTKNILRIQVFWDVTIHWVSVSEQFKGTKCLYLQGSKKNSLRYCIPLKCQKTVAHWQCHIPGYLNAWKKSVWESEKLINILLHSAVCCHFLILWPASCDTQLTHLYVPFHCLRQPVSDYRHLVHVHSNVSFCFRFW